MHKLLILYFIFCLLILSSFSQRISAQIRRRTSGNPRIKLKRITKQKSSVEKLAKELNTELLSSNSLNKNTRQNNALEHGEDRDYLESYLQWLRQRAYPNDTVDWRAYQRAYTKRSIMKSLRPTVNPGILGLDQINSKWEFVGPTNSPTPFRYFFGRGIIAGRVNDVAYDPVSAGTYYIAAAGGLWRTTNRGADWSCLSDKWANQYVSSVVVHPTNANIIFAGTGDFDGDSNGSGAHGFGVMRSTDGGTIWNNLLGQELKGFSIRRILFARDNPNVVLVAAGRHANKWGQVWRSINGGTNWTRITTPASASDDIGAEWSDMEESARDAAGHRFTYVIGFDNASGKLWRSSNQGETWNMLSLPTSPNGQSLLDISTSPTDPKTIYLLSGTDQKLWKSTDAGATWLNITNNFPNDNASTRPRYNWEQKYYDTYITCSTRADTGKDVLYVGLIDLVASVDGGATWQSVGHVYDRDQNGDALAEIHGDQHRATVNPTNPNEILIANDGGVYLSTYNPTTNVWTFNTTMNGNLGITQIFQAAFHPTDPNIMLAGTRDNATPASSGDPINWSTIGEGDGGFCAINPINPNVQYATSQFMTIYRTSDNWMNSIEITPDYGAPPRNWFGPITLDPNNPNLLYVGTLYLHQRDDSKTENNWKMRLGDQALANDANHYITFIAIAPSDSNRIYTGASDGQVWMTKDQGLHWLQINAGSNESSISLPNRWVTSIAVHPTNPDSILVGLSGTGSSHLWRCDNTISPNRIWKNAGGVPSAATSLPDIPLNTVVIDPRQPDQVYYVGTDVGVFFSRDAGLNWANATTSLGMPNVQVNVLSLNPNTDFLMAATDGRGIWRIRLPLNNGNLTIK